jgi:hypothetical protein
VSDISCDIVDELLRTVAHYARVYPTTDLACNSVTAACESLAIDHLRNTQSCVRSGLKRYGLSGHLLMVFPDPEFRILPMLYRYTRALFRYWPHIAHINPTDYTYRGIPYPLPTSTSQTSISQMRLQDLCGLCTDIMHDCLYSGAVPDDWITPTEPVPQNLFNVTDSYGFFAHSDDSRPRSSLCELCGVYLPRSGDFALRDSFLLFEKMAFERVFLNTDVLAQTQSCSPKSEYRLSKVLPFESPSSMLRGADELQALRATLRFQQFVWCRQKLRAVRSLLTTIRRQFFSIAPPDEWLTCRLFGSPGYPSDQLQDIWLAFLRSFIQPPKWRITGCRDCRSRLCEDLGRVIVSLRSDGFVTTCEDCYKAAAPPTHASKASFVFAIWLQSRTSKGPSEARLVARGVVKAISETVAWYSDTAPAFGLGYLIPPDIAEIQRALLLVPESEIWALKT